MYAIILWLDQKDEGGIDPQDLVIVVQSDACNVNPFMCNTCVDDVYTGVRLDSFVPLLPPAIFYEDSCRISYGIGPFDVSPSKSTILISSSRRLKKQRYFKNICAALSQWNVSCWWYAHIMVNSCTNIWWSKHGYPCNEISVMGYSYRSLWILVILSFGYVYAPAWPWWWQAAFVAMMLWEIPFFNNV